MKLFKTFLVFLFLIFAFFSFAQADPILKIESNLTAENTFSDPITPKLNGSNQATDYGTVHMAIRGTWVGTVVLQQAFDFGTAFENTGKSWTSNTTQIITSYEPGTSFCLGFETGGYTSGTCKIRMSRGK